MQPLLAAGMLQTVCRILKEMFQNWARAGTILGWISKVLMVQSNQSFFQAVHQTNLQKEQLGSTMVRMYLHVFVNGPTLGRFFASKNQSGLKPQLLLTAGKMWIKSKTLCLSYSSFKSLHIQK